MTNREVVNALAAARARGVDVRVLLEERPFGGDRYARLGFSLLSGAHVPVRWANEGSFTYTHEKSMEIDGQVAGIFTFNFTSSGFFRNREFGVVDKSAADAGAIGTIFDADWNRRAPHYSDPQLVVSPYTSRGVTASLVDGARHTLDIYAEEVNDASIENHIAAAAHRGVRVRLITSQSSGGVDYLRRSRVQVKLMPHPYVHAKALVADGSRVFIGSENLSTTSLDHNREMGIVLNDHRPAGVVESTFDSDWTGGGSPSPVPGSAPSMGRFAVHVSASPSSVHKGQRETISAATSPGASCTIQVTYPDGYVSRAHSLSGSRTADSSGMVSWSWSVGSTVTGTSRAAVTCTLGSSTSTGSAPFTIT